MQTFIDKYVQQGEANILIRQLKTKFGMVPGETMARIEQADADTLLRWSERILTAEKPEDLFH
ncbi:DUF4351 domain-containing protein [Ectothiorhodospiraceae bacterium BW-2]|nr:DUF4351 domain-containing protein [Ectothiorhodospiraceae bacterium BW-2]